MIKWIGTDHAQAEKEAAVAAEQEAIVQLIRNDYPLGLAEHITCSLIADEIRIRSNTDALAAHDARVKAEALREAIDAVHQECWTDGDQDQVTPELLAEQATTTLAIRTIKSLIPDQHKEDT